MAVGKCADVIKVLYLTKKSYLKKDDIMQQYFKTLISQLFSVAYIFFYANSTSFLYA